MPEEPLGPIFEQTTSDVPERRVALIQWCLRDRGLYNSKIDGLYGPGTKSAVDEFQQKQGLNVDGKVGATTGKLLGLPFWDQFVARRLNPPFRDEEKHGSETEFRFRSEKGIGHFFSSSPDAAFSSSNILTRRALRSNNPGALNISRWQRNDMKGYVGRTKPDNSPNANKTTIYETPEHGIAAWGFLLRRIYFEGRERVTVGEIVDKYRGNVPRQTYLTGYKNFSNGELVENFNIDLYDNAQLSKLAIAAFSHEFGSWFPLTDEQLLVGFAITDTYISREQRESEIAVDQAEMDPEFYLFGFETEEDPDSETGEAELFTEDDVDRLEEDIDTVRSVTSLDLPPEEAEAPAARRPRLEIGAARWPNDPANAPDTWHLPAEFQQGEFDLTMDVVNQLINVGHFKPDLSTNGRFVISLRGCKIADGSPHAIDKTSLRLRVMKPDHEDYLCLVGVVDTRAELISLYMGSTVPRRTGMLRFYNKINFGTAGRNCNMLPSGCYEHCVGTHGGEAGSITFVLRLGDGPTSGDAGPAVVLRTVNDLTYGTLDLWDNTRPADNIHPGFLSTSFSSLGCLTIRGTQTPNGSFTSGTREWRKFRQKLGFEGELNGRRFDNLLVTGHEAAAVAAALEAGGDLAALVCLRQGSRGEKVGRLQSQLGIEVDNVFGPNTCEELLALQRKKLRFATGTWSARMANELGLQF